MALSFPLTTAQFMDILPIKEIVFDIPEAMELSETGGGEVLVAELGTRLWRGQVTLADMTSVEADEVVALIDVLRRPGASFMAYDVRRPTPRLDPTGSILGSMTPTLRQVNANRRDITLENLPPSYRLRRHDYVGFSYGSNPTRFALHRIAGSVQASGAGTTPWFEITPSPRPGYTIGTPVTLMKAVCKAIIVPKSFQPGRNRATMTVGASFEFLQTLR